MKLNIPITIISILMVMVIACSSTPYDYNSFSTTDNSNLMIPTLSPEPTKVMVMVNEPTPVIEKVIVYAPTLEPTAMPLNDIKNEVVGSLINFNNLHNNNAQIMSRIGRLQDDGAISFGESGPLLLSVLTQYEQSIRIWHGPEFNSNEWNDLEYQMKEMQSAELVKIKDFKELLLDLRDAYIGTDPEEFNNALDRMSAFRTSESALKSARIQDNIIKQFNIDPKLIGFYYVEVLKEANEDIPHTM